MVCACWLSGVAVADDVVVEAVATGEALANVEGGLATGARYLDNVKIDATIDGARAFHVDGLTVYGSLLYDNGASISELTGSAQGTSNIEAPRALRRYELWADEAVGAHSVRIGFLDLNADFDSIDSAALFLNPAHGIGTDVSQSGDNGPSIFPNAGLGARYCASIGPVSGLVAMFEGTPGDPDAPERSAVRWSKEEGILGIAEVQVANGRVQKAAIGTWGYDHRAVPWRGGEPVRGDVGAYGFVDLRLLGDGSTGARSLVGWARVGVANGFLHPFDHYEGGGLAVHAPIAGRDDALGASIASAHVSGGGRETIVECTAAAVFGSALAVQPDAQLTLNPGGDPAVPAAVTLGVRVDLAWRSEPTADVAP